MRLDAVPIVSLPVDEWLDSIKGGYSRFVGTLSEMGIEDTEDLRVMRKQRVRELEGSLVAAGLKTVAVDRIMDALYAERGVSRPPQAQAAARQEYLPTTPRRPSQHGASSAHHHHRHHHHHHNHNHSHPSSATTASGARRPQSAPSHHPWGGGRRVVLTRQRMADLAKPKEPIAPPKEDAKMKLRVKKRSGGAAGWEWDLDGDRQVQWDRLLRDPRPAEPGTNAAPAPHAAVRKERTSEENRIVDRLTLPIPKPDPPQYGPAVTKKVSVEHVQDLWQSNAALYKSNRQRGEHVAAIEKSSHDRETDVERRRQGRRFDITDSKNKKWLQDAASPRCRRQISPAFFMPAMTATGRVHIPQRKTNARRRPMSASPRLYLSSGRPPAATADRSDDGDGLPHEPETEPEAVDDPHAAGAGADDPPRGDSDDDSDDPPADGPRATPRTPPAFTLDWDDDTDDTDDTAAAPHEHTDGAAPPEEDIIEACPPPL